MYLQVHVKQSFTECIIHSDSEEKKEEKTNTQTYYKATRLYFYVSRYMKVRKRMREVE